MEEKSDLLRALPNLCIQRSCAIREKLKFVSNSIDKLKESVEVLYPSKPGVSRFIKETVLNICSQIDILKTVLPDFPQTVYENLFAQISEIVKNNILYHNTPSLLFSGPFSFEKYAALIKLDHLFKEMVWFSRNPHRSFQYDYELSGLRFEIFLFALKTNPISNFTITPKLKYPLTEEQLRRLKTEAGLDVEVNVELSNNI